MKYVKATVVLPDHLIAEIQQYIQGTTIYIPKTKQTYQKWGDCSGSRKKLTTRNKAIRKAFACGSSIDQLASEYFLTPETIKKIVYSK